MNSAPAVSAGVSAAPSPPRAVPQGSWQLFRQVLDHGGPGYLQFAITNRCNARCDFCNFAVDRLPAKERRSVTLAQATAAMDIMARNHIGYLLFVGGEPLVHHDLLAMVRYAASLGIRPLVCTNGSLWTDQNMPAFAQAGLTSVIMSIDTHDVAAHESNRGLPDSCRKIRHANQVLQSLGVPTTASVTVSRLIKDYALVPPFLRSLGFDSCTFSYPLAALSSSYLSFSDSRLVAFTTDELLGIFETIKRLKGNADCPVINPEASLTDMQRHLRQQPERFGCLGGYKYFYLDWNLDLYRCHYWEKPMCSIYEFDASRLIRDGCTRCMIDCYRDASVLQSPAICLHDAWQHLKQGRPIAAAGNLLDVRNLLALQALWRDRKFVARV